MDGVFAAPTAFIGRKDIFALHSAGFGKLNTLLVILVKHNVASPLTGYDYVHLMSPLALMRKKASDLSSLDVTDRAFASQHFLWTISQMDM